MYKSIKSAFSNLYGDYKKRGYILNHTHHFPFLDYQIAKFRYLKLPTFRYLKLPTFRYQKLPTFRYLNHQIRYLKL